MIKAEFYFFLFTVSSPDKRMCKNDYCNHTFHSVLSDSYTKTKSTAAQTSPTGPWTKRDQTDLSVTWAHLRSMQYWAIVIIICHSLLPTFAPPPRLPSPLLSADNSQVRCWDVDCRPGCKNSLHCFCVSLHNVSGVDLCLDGSNSITNLSTLKSKYQTTTKAGYYCMITAYSVSIFKIQYMLLRICVYL